MADNDFDFVPPCPFCGELLEKEVVSDTKVYVCPKCGFTFTPGTTSLSAESDQEN